MRRSNISADSAAVYCLHYSFHLGQKLSEQRVIAPWFFGSVAGLGQIADMIEQLSLKTSGEGVVFFDDILGALRSSWTFAGGCRLTVAITGGSFAASGLDGRASGAHGAA